MTMGGALFDNAQHLSEMSNYIHYKVWDEITYPFPNLNGKTVEVWEWISDNVKCLGHYPGTIYKNRVATAKNVDACMFHRRDSNALL